MRNRGEQEHAWFADILQCNSERLLKNSRGTLPSPSAATADPEKKPVIAAVNCCQNQEYWGPGAAPSKIKREIRVLPK